MTSSEDDPDNTLAAALVALQADMPAITKDAEGQYGKYADLADVSKALMPVMASCGLAFTSRPTMVIRDDGAREFVLAYALVHAPSGEALTGEYPLGTGNPQQLGSAITYARRFSLCAVTGAVADIDDDGQAASRPAPQPAKRGNRREPPPIRPFEQLPRNADGSLSRSRCTDAELKHYGNMTDAQQREHNKLERGVLGTDSKGKSEPSTERLPSAPGGEEFYDPPPPRVPQPAPPARSAIFGHFNRLAGKDGPFTDEQRYGAMSTITGRKITSTNDLTAAEGVEVIRFLQKRKDHDALVEALAIKAGEDVA